MLTDIRRLDYVCHWAITTTGKILMTLRKGLLHQVPMYEEISLNDFHGLVDSLVTAVTAVDQEDPIRDTLD